MAESTLVPCSPAESSSAVVGNDSSPMLHMTWAGSGIPQLVSQISSRWAISWRLTTNIGRGNVCIQMRSTQRAAHASNQQCLGPFYICTFLCSLRPHLKAPIILPSAITTLSWQLFHCLQHNFSLSPLSIFSWPGLSKNGFGMKHFVGPRQIKCNQQSGTAY